MQLKRVKFNNGIGEVLFYSNSEINIPEDWNVTTEDVPKITSYPDLSIINWDEFQIQSIKKIKTTYSILAKEGISTYNDFKNAYFLLRNKQLNKSARIRQFVEQVYSDISCFF